ncbi:G patch domain-containing protein 4 isoform X2 [Eleutherodactylus coqui]
MDAPSSMKSAGLKFAEEHMQRHGWTEGKGLGKREDGISEAIKVKVKCDTAGVGHNSAEQFTFHWWDHVFNKTASSIAVEPNQDGVTVKKLSEDDGAVSNKKPRKAMLSTNMLYGRFIKSATLTSGGEELVEKSSSSDDSSSSSSEDEDLKFDLSSATKLSDEDLVRICGGRTAHKGARHGLTMSAKLSRIEEQERAFMEKYGKKETKLQPHKASPEELDGEKSRAKNKKREEKDNPADSKIPKKKKKKHKKGVEEYVPTSHDQNHVPSMEEDTVTSKKKKRSKVRDNVEVAEEVEILGDHKNCFSAEVENTRPAKKKKRKTEGEESIMVNSPTEDGESRREKEDKAYENAEEEARKSKRRKKKKNKKTEDEEELAKAEEDTTCAEEEQSNLKKWKVAEENDGSVEEEERSRKRKKKVLNNEDKGMDEDKDAKKKSNRKHRRD